jgi:hypothetical protein
LYTLDHTHNTSPPPKHNARSTKRLLVLASRMRQLRGFVAVSSAHANVHFPPGSCVDEAVYPLAFGAQEVHSPPHVVVCCVLCMCLHALVRLTCVKCLACVQKAKTSNIKPT